jgi:hypothetical protein
VRILIVPLFVLGALASYIAGLGLASRWHTTLPLEYLIAGALHAAWLIPATRRSGPGLTAVCWTATAWLARKGIAAFYLADSELLLAVLLEGVCLLLALSIAPAEPWPERLARWRRSRADIVTQLRMGKASYPGGGYPCGSSPMELPTRPLAPTTSVSPLLWPTPNIA